MTLGVLQVDPSKWLAFSNYSAKQTGMGRLPLTVQLNLTKADAVQVMVANWNPRGASSTWELRSAKLRRVGG